MAYPQHWLLSFGGHFIGTGLAPEIWECSLRGGPDAGSDKGYGHEDDVLANIAPLLAQWFHDPHSQIRSDAQLEYLKLNEIGPDGRYAHPVSHTHVYNPAIVGVVGPQCPPILTCAFSWRTSEAVRGPGSHGRIYPPVALPGLTTDQIESGDRPMYLRSANSLLMAINAVPAVNPGTPFRGFSPAIVSKHGQFNTINKIMIGSVVDVQRRRKNQLIEVYSSQNYDTGAAFP